jgi:hypothetical protein
MLVQLLTRRKVGRRGLEPRTSALDRTERCAYESGRPSVTRGVMWYGSSSSRYKARETISTRSSSSRLGSDRVASFSSGA